MILDQLIGLSLESITFSKSSYSLEICGRSKNGDYLNYNVSTSYKLSGKEGGDDVCEGVSSFIWPFLERTVENVAESPSELAIIFSFEGGLSFAVWEEKPLMDNLLIISDKQTGAWYPIG